MTLFYSMMFCPLGVALLASAVWRVEHRGTSWNAMRTTPHTPAAVALANRSSAHLVLVGKAPVRGVALRRP